ncbi:hypothetical protein ASD62_07525 [Phycicoccus sp. Root563]|uniref:DUF4245 domain-containing protein n=1 Tax=unclassified Phycicoccus TaxID=2637926 RepID=UPI000702ED6D|nr:MULTISPECIES: DUF4245 domain-containing protein [unclassified Phycicoccus]KQU70907.1 hypothetical protein ASC58_03910 [Phycicoccus sp. Root101]KQZ89175.1 hypothetical protein ASD62_07525 [Phycicoccus sp. Root563]
MSTQAPRSSYANGSVPNMIRSLLVIGALVAVLVAVVPRVNNVTQPPVDVAGASVEVARESGWPIEVPTNLPDGWRATSVRYERSTDGLMVWHAGYQSPTGNYVAIEQTKDATAKWIEAQTNRAAAKGTVEAGGRTWTTYVRSGKVQNSLVHEAGAGDELTTIITGTGTLDELSAFAGTLQKAPAG